MAGKTHVDVPHTELLSDTNIFDLHDSINSWLDSNKTSVEVKSVSITVDGNVSYGLITYTKSEWVEL